MISQRDLIGYGETIPTVTWPGHARVAVQFVLNVEEGAERSIVNGDSESESYLHELPGRPARVGERDRSVESMYEYGSRVGIWRILRLFRERHIPLTAFAVGKALELNPDVGYALNRDGHEIAGHGYRWFDYRSLSKEEEQAHIQQTIKVIESFSGQSPCGWYTGRISKHTTDLIRGESGFLYTSDAYNDDLPYWLGGDKPFLVIPYTLLNNDIQYLQPGGCASGDAFFGLLKDAFDQLWLEGAEAPKMMSIGLHCRISGHPARAAALARFLDYVQAQDKVWLCRREDIARHWYKMHPYIHC